jgi:hypothetical protein
MECILASHIQHAECTRIKHVATLQLMTRREDGIRGMDHSINPRNSRDAAQHTLSYGPPWAHYLGGYQDRLLGGPLGLLGLSHTAPDGMGRKDYGGEVLG